jgi:GTP-binding protein
VFAPVFLKSAAHYDGFPRDEGLEVAFSGRSNSGKSTAINCIAGRVKLARVSKTPGRTQLINFFEVAPGRRLVDLPGYGFARAPKATQRHWESLVDDYFHGRRSLAGLVITIDIRRGPGDLDAAMIGLAQALATPILVLLTKSDKLGRSAAAARRRHIEHDLAGVDCVAFSAPTKQGIVEARGQVEAWLQLEPA